MYLYFWDTRLLLRVFSLFLAHIAATNTLAQIVKVYFVTNAHENYQ